MTAIPSPVQAVLELFDGPLGEVRFADIDASALRRLVSEVESATAELEAQQAALDALRKATAERQEHLLVQAQRALAYARIYAEGDEELSARLAQIHLPRTAKRQKADATAETDAPVKSGARSPRAARATASERTAESASDQDVPESAADTAAADAIAKAQAATRRSKRRESARTLIDEGTADNAP